MSEHTFSNSSAVLSHNNGKYSSEKQFETGKKW